MHKMEFDPKRFLRRLRPEIKERLLGQLTLLDLMNKNRCEEDPEPDRDYFAWMRIPEDRRKTSSRDLARINDMCSDKARFYLMQEAHVLWRSKPDLLQEATEMPTCDLAATLFLESEISFKRAWSEFYIDDFAFRVKRKGKDDRQPKVSAGTKERLQRRIQLFYKAGGEGHRNCKVEDHDDENRFAIFLYHEHRVRYREKFDENGILLSEEDKPVEQAMAVYYKHTHVLMVKVRQKKLRAELITLMGELYFDDPYFFDHALAREFDLSPLADPKFDFPFRPADGISSVSVEGFSFWHPDARLGLLKDVPCPQGHVAALAALGLTQDQVDYYGVKIKFAPDGRIHRYNRTACISLPDRINLGDTPRDRLLTKYLDEWGFFATETDDADAEAVEDAAQLGELFGTRVGTRYRGDSPPVAP